MSTESGQENIFNALQGKTEDPRVLAQREKEFKESVSKNHAEIEGGYVSQTNPTLPAQFHGNKPSKGAVIDADLLDEDKELLKQKGPA